MPDLGGKTNRWRLERILVWYFNVDLKRPSCIRGIRRRRKRALEILQARAIDGSGKNSRVVSIGLDILQLLGYPAVSTARHDYEYLPCYIDAQRWVYRRICERGKAWSWVQGVATCKCLQGGMT